MNISNERLKELERAEAKLQALDAGGVDNWEWYSQSLEEYHKANELEERLENLITDLAEIFGECAYEPSERGAGIAFNDEAFNSALSFVTTNKVTFSDLGE